MQVPARRLPRRDYQTEIIQNYFDPDVDELMLVIARRGGKTTTIFSECVVPDLVREVQTIVMVYPTAKMGFDNFWTNIEDDGFKTIEQIPKQLIASQSNSPDDMRITLINGSVFRVVGATNHEALRGANGKKYIFDEFADQYIEAVNVVAPITDANGGKRIYMGTPKIDGINGETMRRMHEQFKKMDSKFTNYIKADRYLSAGQLRKSRDGYIARNGNDFKYLQEMMLDWGQSSSGSYYGQLMSAKDADGSIGNHPYNPEYPVYTSWDLGKADSMVVLFWQFYDYRPRIIECFETNEISLSMIIPYIKSKNYNYGWHFLPHDGTVASLNDNVRRIDFLHQHGIINASTLKREGIGIGIDRVIQGLSKVDINRPMCAEFCRKIRLYRRKFNPNTGDYVGPDHKSESHVADALRYMFTAMFWYFDKKGAFLIENDTQPASLELNDKELETTYYF